MCICAELKFNFYLYLVHSTIDNGYNTYRKKIKSFLKNILNIIYHSSYNMCFNFYVGNIDI